MRRAWLAILFTLVMTTSSLAGNTAESFSLPSSTGTIKLDQYKGKVVYLDFWASWCVPCRHSFPWMNDMQKKYKSKGLQIITINLDKKRELANRFLKELPANFIVAFDPEGKTAEAYNVMGMPSSYLINRNGEIIYRHIGFQKSKTAELENRIVQALK